MTTVADAQDAKLTSRLESISHILLVLSGKGGVGKSSVSVQLAVAMLLADPTLKIGLLDIDLTGPSLPRMLGLEGRDVHMSRDGWIPVYLNSTHQAAVGGKGAGVLACMSIGFLLKNSSESVVWRGPKKNAMIKQFLTEVRWGELDYLIIDTPPGTSDEHISLLENLRPLLVPRSESSPPLPTLSSLLVSTPQALALLDVSKELTFVRRTNLPLLGLIENMSGYVCPHCSDIVGIFGQGGGEDFCRREEERKHSTVEGEGGGCAFLGRVPIDRELVGLLDGSVTVETIDDVLSTTPTLSTTLVNGSTSTSRNIVERYAEIPSFPIVKEITKKVVELIAEQEVRERAERIASGL